MDRSHYRLPIVKHTATTAIRCKFPACATKSIMSIAELSARLPYESTLDRMNQLENSKNKLTEKRPTKTV